MDAFSALESILPDSAKKNSLGHLTIGGVDVVSLAEQFGTPLYVYDAGQLKDRCLRYVRALESGGEPYGDAIFASKSFPAVAMLRLASECGLGADVAGAGELYAALKAGVDPRRIYFHGNAKSISEITLGIQAGVGKFVVDNSTEMARLEEFAATRPDAAEKPLEILIRITPGIEAHTHEFIKTGQHDSKFGFYLADGSAEAAVKEAAAGEHIKPVGIHLHIGSQILELQPFAEAARIAVDFVDEIRRKHSIVLEEIDFGGGLGATYVPGDGPPAIEDYVAVLKDTVRQRCRDRDLPLPRMVLEPGRSITANAGVTLYTVESIKSAPSGRIYVAVDGGMSDNLRPMLYGAPYSALVANKVNDDHSMTASLAGKHCESGDILIERAALATTTTVGDLILTPATGAYGWSMASNYNGQPRAAVVFVEDGKAELVVERETLDDLVRLQH